MLCQFLLYSKGTQSYIEIHIPFLFFFFFFFFFCFFRATPAAYGGFQARGPIRDTAVGLYHSHSSAGSKPLL